VVSDFSAIHHIHDITELPGPVFFRMAYRLGAYQGAVAARMMMARAEGGSQPAATQQPAPIPQQPPARPVSGRMPPPGSKQAIQGDRILSQIFSFAD
jgi:hypothetical protein